MGNFNIVSATSLVTGQPEDVSPILANFQAIQAILNGGIDDTNIAAAAGISLAKTTPKITTSTWLAGPPALPANNDIWIATSVEGTASRWTFQYEAASLSWKFIGGPKFYGTQGSAVNIGGASVWTNVVGSSIIVRRGGIWSVGATFDIFNLSASPSAITSSLYKNSAIAGNGLSFAVPMNVANGIQSQVTIPEHTESFAALDTVGMMGFTTVANVNLAPGTWWIQPVSIT
jgi:hypothetical protein